MSRIMLITVAAAAVIGAAIATLTLSPGTMNGVSRVIGTTGQALIGGPFKLTNHEGNTVTDKTFHGKHMLVYFGFTHCPEICPSSLQVMGEALERMGPVADAVTPVFITVDPERDTVELMGDYVSNFHPRMVGLTGSEADVGAAIKTFRVFAQKVKTGDDPDDYTMDHSSFYYLMGPDGMFLTHFNHGISPEKLAAGLTERLASS